MSSLKAGTLLNSQASDRHPIHFGWMGESEERKRFGFVIAVVQFWLNLRSEWQPVIPGPWGHFSNHITGHLLFLRCHEFKSWCHKKVFLTPIRLNSALLDKVLGFLTPRVTFHLHPHLCSSLPKPRWLPRGGASYTFREEGIDFCRGAGGSVRLNGFC